MMSVDLTKTNYSSDLVEAIVFTNKAIKKIGRWKDLATFESRALLRFEEIMRTSREAIELIIEKAKEPRNLHLMPLEVSTIEDDSLRQIFLAYRWPSFVKETADLAIQIQDSDIESFGSEHLTPLASAFMDLYQELDRHGFYHTRGRSIHFWSGEAAYKKAVQRTSQRTSLDDNSVLSGDIVHEIFKAYEILETEEGLISPLCQGHRLLKLYASSFAVQATGDVVYYTSNDGQNKTQRSLTVGNYFWEAELPVLQRLYKRGIVTSISVLWLDGEVWRPLDFHSPCEGGRLRLYRRDASIPRLAISLNCLRTIAYHWGLYTLLKRYLLNKKTCNLVRSLIVALR